MTSTLARPDPRTSQSIQLTDEQRAVVKAITIDKRNAIVNAVAGSGKTRTALTTSIEWLSSYGGESVASHTAGKRVLLLAYNKRLQQDMVNQRDTSVPPSQRSLIEIRTIHGFGHRYFGGSGMTTDRQLTRWTNNRTPPTITLPSFGLVIVDEAQDLTPVLFNFIHYVVSLQRRPQVLVLGDPFQLLYRFNGADEAYILDADTKFADVAADVKFDHFKLSICFRITHEMASWINTNLNPNNLMRAKAPYSDWFDRYRERIAAWWGHGIKANPRRSPEPGSVTYFVRSSYPGSKLLGVVDEIVKVFEEYDTDCCALLSPSIVASQVSPVRLITNYLKTVDGQQQSWFIDDGRNVEETSASDVRQNKRIASTIHKFKGRERDAIVLVGLDSFPEMIEKNDPRNVFNMFYVGATRARKRLLIVQWSDPAYATHPSRRSALDDDDDTPRGPYPVTRTLDYCPYDPVLCEESPRCLEVKTVARVRGRPLGRDDYIVSGAYHAKRRRTLENVSSVIGLAVEVGLQLLLDDGKLEVPEVDRDSQMPQDLWSFLTTLARRAPNKSVYSWAEILEVATALLTLRDRLYSRWRQVQNFAGWPVVAQSGKLDEVVHNLVHLLYVPFCCVGEGTAEAGPNASQEAAEAANEIPYAEKLDSLKKLRREGRILFHEAMIFNMQQNADFVRQYSDAIIGEANIMLISKDAAERLRKAEEAVVMDKEKHTNCNPAREVVGVDDDLSDMTLVEVAVTSKTSHDHLLQVGCYAAIWREHAVAIAKTAAQQAQADGAAVGMGVNIVAPKMFLVYPNLGLLLHGQMHMHSFEFLHRVGYRKLNRPFDTRLLERLEREKAATAESPQAASQIVTGQSVSLVEEVVVID